MSDESFQVVRLILYLLGSLLAVLVAWNPRAFFRYLSFGRVSMTDRLVGPFRILGVFNLFGCVYMVIRSLIKMFA